MSINLIANYAGARMLAVPSSRVEAVSDAGAAFIVATGGTITTDGNYKVHTFTGSGTFEVTSGSGNVWYLVVAGGAGGGYWDGGGGGAGGYKSNAAYDYAVTVQSYTVT